MEKNENKPFLKRTVRGVPILGIMILCGLVTVSAAYIVQSVVFDTTITESHSWECRNNKGGVWTNWTACSDTYDLTPMYPGETVNLRFRATNAGPEQLSASADCTLSNPGRMNGTCLDTDADCIENVNGNGGTVVIEYEVSVNGDAPPGATSVTCDLGRDDAI